MAEVNRRLREKNEPVKLFGESHEDTCQRLRLVEMTVKDEDKGINYLNKAHIYLIIVTLEFTFYIIIKQHLQICVYLRI